MNELEESLKQYHQAEIFVKETLDLGVEYSNEDGTIYGVMHRSTESEYPYRISWYDEIGFSGHSYLRKMEDATSIFLSDLGTKLKLAPGSLKRLFSKWPPMIKEDDDEQVHRS